MYVEKCATFVLLKNETEANLNFMRKQLLSILCILTGLTTASAEVITSDSIVEDLCKQGERCMNEAKYDSSFYYYNKALSQKGVKKTARYAKIISDRGLVYYTTGDMDKALEDKLEAARLLNLQEHPDLETLTDAYSTLGIIYRRRQMPDSALIYYQRALETAEELKSDVWLANIYNNLAVFYGSDKRLDEAVTYIRKAISHVEKTEDVSEMIFAYQIECSLYLLKGEPERGIPSLRKALALAGQHELPLAELRCIPNLMGLYSNLNKKDSVMYYMRRGDELLTKLSAKSVEAMGFIEMKARLLPEFGRYREALKWLQYLRDHPQNTQSSIDAIFFKMAQSYQKLGEKDKAYAYMDSARMWTDSLARQDVETQLSDFSAKYETREKELEIAHLKQEQLKQEADRMTMGIIGIVLISAMAISIIIVVQKRKQVEKNMKLLEQESDLKAARKYIEGLESERKRFAKELHDGVANDLLGLQMKLSTVGNNPDEKEEMVKSVNELRQNVRNISHELMPPEFNHLNIDKILGYYLTDMQKTYGLALDYETMPDAGYEKIPQETAYEVYRIAQELMTNIVKHAGARSVSVALMGMENGKFRLKIESDGNVFPTRVADEANRPTGIGIRTIHDRAKSISAVFERMDENDKTVFLLTF